MSDLYHIPNDDGKTYRMKKFVEYQHEVPSIHYRFLGEWVKKYQLPKDDAVVMCWLMSLTYNEITCVLLFEMLKSMDYETVWGKYKPQLIFGSARKYAKLKTVFVDSMRAWENKTQGQPYYWLKGLKKNNPEDTYIAVAKELRSIPNCGRFAADLFLETATYLRDYLELDITEPINIDWDNCANLVSGIDNIFYDDEKANEFDKTGKLTSQDKTLLSARLRVIQKTIHNTYPEQNAEISYFIGKICSFRNLFKGARYGGFHHDRELGWLNEYRETMPEYEHLWEKCFELRKQIFPSKYLGEERGWSGIRTERKKLWLKTGKTGVENDE